MIIDNLSGCQVYAYKQSISQFYVFASSDFFLSNKKAVKEIKKNNTEELVKGFLRKLNFADLSCNAQS